LKLKSFGGDSVTAIVIPPKEQQSMNVSIQTAVSTSLRQMNAMVLSCVVFAILSTPLVAQENKETPTVAGHATVHIVFLVPLENSTQTLQGSVPQAHVGDIVLPMQSIRPISISIDGEFVGHALTELWRIKPVYVLPHGKHKFEFACEGFKSSKSELTVIGTGSTQYLIVKLEPNAAASPAKETSEQPDSNKSR
jgi:hypothetical protein